uniref:Uncharacterized protein n=1 Tax=Romanomermis culicivorax TaxID=13658 RepID=A0A915JRJ9_ROMCU
MIVCLVVPHIGWLFPEWLAGCFTGHLVRRSTPGLIDCRIIFIDWLVASRINWFVGRFADMSIDRFPDLLLGCFQVVAVGVSLYFSVLWTENNIVALIWETMFEDFVDEQYLGIALRNNMAII